MKSWTRDHFACRRAPGFRPVPPQELGRNLRGIPRHRARESARDPQRLRARVRHDLVVRHRYLRRVPREAAFATASSAIPTIDGRDAVFGLDGPLWLLVNAFKSAAQGYGIEKRVLLLHGPVGSSKSTIARLLKKGLERYPPRTRGAVLDRLGDRRWRRSGAR